MQGVFHRYSGGCGKKNNAADEDSDKNTVQVTTNYYTRVIVEVILRFVKVELFYIINVNLIERIIFLIAVVPSYFLVWYNTGDKTPHNHWDYAGFFL